MGPAYGFEFMNGVSHELQSLFVVLGLNFLHQRSSEPRKGGQRTKRKKQHVLNQEKCASGPVSPIISAINTFHMEINSYSALNALVAIATKYRCFLEISLGSEALRLSHSLGSCDSTQKSIPTVFEIIRSIVMEVSEKPQPWDQAELVTQERLEPDGQHCQLSQGHCGWPRL